MHSADPENPPSRDRVFVYPVVVSRIYVEAAPNELISFHFPGGFIPVLKTFRAFPWLILVFA
jgi:hypothetical protein